MARWVKLGSEANMYFNHGLELNRMQGNIKQKLPSDFPEDELARAVQHNLLKVSDSKKDFELNHIQKWLKRKQKEIFAEIDEKLEIVENSSEPFRYTSNSDEKKIDPTYIEKIQMALHYAKNKPVYKKVGNRPKVVEKLTHFLETVNAEKDVVKIIDED